MPPSYKDPPVLTKQFLGGERLGLNLKCGDMSLLFRTNKFPRLKSTGLSAQSQSNHCPPAVSLAFPGGRVTTPL